MEEKLKNELLNQSLEEAIRRIAAALRPEKIYLFGSHAWGTVTQDSDIDLLVIVKDSNQPTYRLSHEAYRSLRGIREPFEVVVRTVDEVEKSKFVVTSLVKKMVEQGKLVYG